MHHAHIEQHRLQGLERRGAAAEFPAALLAIDRDTAIERQSIGQLHDDFHRRLKGTETRDALIARGKKRRRRQGQRAAICLEAAPVLEFD